MNIINIFITSHVYFCSENFEDLISFFYYATFIAKLNHYNFLFSKHKLFIILSAFLIQGPQYTRLLCCYKLNLRFHNKGSQITTALLCGANFISTVSFVFIPVVTVPVFARRMIIWYITVLIPLYLYHLRIKGGLTVRHTKDIVNSAAHI